MYKSRNSPSVYLQTVIANRNFQMIVLTNDAVEDSHNDSTHNICRMTFRWPWSAFSEIISWILANNIFAKLILSLFYPSEHKDLIHSLAGHPMGPVASSLRSLPWSFSFYLSLLNFFKSKVKSSWLIWWFCWFDWSVAAGSLSCIGDLPLIYWARILYQNSEPCFGRCRRHRRALL